MHKLFLPLFALLFTLSNQAFAHQTNAINWMTMEEVQVAQEKEGRKVIMDAYTKWCGPCKKMMSETFTNPDVIEYINENFYAVKFNAEGEKDVVFKDNTYSNPGFNPEARGRNSQHEFAAYLGVRAYPTLVYFDEDMSVLQAIPGYQGAKQLEVFLKLFSEEHYKDIKTQEEYNKWYESFESTFEG